ncbi:Aspartyl aminopeptidase [Morus notabilis]|uniref:aspartyl aminopeptidase n=1 Tax=Morus notabilis TaxID=981085 RepID=W9QGP4_9ROSA|nr:probable aspartyl aminopeptidase [Morus notabilis]XP_024029255.1 probable aspartyl aminopeptidase [Morus notabilis]XP_024029259.1 probable aspartyl aminopeptidase [Morus notabilis]EXB36961.1 Aspartyl aminopeptidase [Morus notabilis]
MATITRLQLRLQLLHTPATLKPSILLPNVPRLSPSSFNFKSTRSFSTTPLLCSVSDHVPESSGNGASASIVGDLLDYLNESWTQFHATAEAKRHLVAAGFHLLNENDEWDLKPGGRYFFTRNMSSLIAFAVGDKYVVGNGFHVIAAHTDSPCLKLKPKSASSKAGYLMVNVQTYGGGLWYTWFDRDLTVAGRVIVRSKDGSFLHKLVKVKKPLLRIPTLAIHLDRTVNKDGFKPNLETHLIPLLASKLEETSLESKDKSTTMSSKDNHHPLLMQVLSDELSCDIEDIVDIELNVCDTQPSCLGGGNNEFIFSGRLDNLASSYCALRALIDSSKSDSDLSSEHAIRMVALFDNEEVGSGSVQGAGAPTMFQAIRRISSCLADKYAGEGAYERAIRQSFLVSADMAHGVHPNFVDRHEEHHRPVMQKGLVIKHNANQRYATSGVTSFLFKEVGRIHNLPTQEFVVRNDMGCGSTIGPILASGVGIRTVDCGIPQLSMHSVREICGKEDIDIAYQHFKAFYKTFSSVDMKLSIDS